MLNAIFYSILDKNALRLLDKINFKKKNICLMKHYSNNGGNYWFKWINNKKRIFKWNGKIIELLMFGVLLNKLLK